MELKTTLVIDDPRVKSVFWGNKFYDTNYPTEVTVSDALRLSHMYQTRVSYPSVDYDPSLWKENKLVGFTADADIVSGYGNCTVNLIKYSEKEGCDVRWIGRGIQVNEMNRLLYKELPLGMGMVWHDQPRDAWAKSPFQKNIAITPFETTNIPATWVPKLNKMSAVFVPCVQNVQMMKDSGVTVPVELIHWGVDENKWYPLKRNNSAFTFGTMGALSARKGTDILIEAFQRAFPPQIQDVSLIAKTSYNVFPFGVKDKRIRIMQTSIDHDMMLENVAKKIDCFVFPTRGEGFGLTPLEMMATGIPAIVTGWSGPMEYMTDEVGWTIPYSMEEATSFTNEVYKEYCGQWAKPSVDDLARLMWHCYTHQDEVKQKGEAAANYVKENWLWSQKIHTFLDALDRHL